MRISKKQGIKGNCESQDKEIKQEGARKEANNLLRKKYDNPLKKFSGQQ